MTDASPATAKPIGATCLPNLSLLPFLASHVHAAPFQTYTGCIHQRKPFSRIPAPEHSAFLLGSCSRPPSAHERNKPVPNTASSPEDSSARLHRASFNWSLNVQRILLLAVGAVNVWAAHARFSGHSLLWFPHAAIALAVFWMLAVTLPRKSP